MQRSHLRVVSPGRSPTVPVAPASSWIEVSVHWSGDPLHVAHVAPGEPYLLAEELPPGARGYVLPGAGLVRVARDGGRTHVTLPSVARSVRFYVEKAAYGREAALRHAVVGRVGEDLSFELGPRSSCRFGLGRFEVAVASIELPAVPVPADRLRRERRRNWLLGASVLANVALVAAILAVR
ncbi:MAG: hypothetical protein JNL79_37995 [Myxococcales bacterium]|nr:hypothetical protein [Myxococcales bacterium]